MIKQFDWEFSTNKELFADLKITELTNKQTMEPVKSVDTVHRYDIEVNDDTHWALVRIAAKQKLHQEDFVEHLLVEFVAEWRAIHEATS